MSTNWIQGIKGLLIDITGVLYESGINKPIPGSIDALAKLNQEKIPYFLVTNETAEDVVTFTKRLNNIGFNLTVDRVISPGPQVARYLKEKNLQPFLLIRPELKKDFEGLSQSNPNCVVVGDAAEHFTYEAMNQAFRILIGNKDAPLIAMGRSRFYQEHGELVLDLGAYVIGLEYACDRKATIIGKPSPKYFDIAVNKLNLQKSQIAMIGDDMISDVKGAQDCGLRGIMVRSGKYRKERDENHATIKPDLIVNNLLELVNKITSS